MNIDLDKQIFFETLPDKSNVPQKNDSHRGTVHSHAYEVLTNHKNEDEFNNDNDKIDYFSIMGHNINNNNEIKLDFKKHFEFKKPLSTIESLTNYSLKDIGTVSPPHSPHNSHSQKENSILSDYDIANYNLNYIEINKDNLNKLFSTPKLDKNSPSKEEDLDKKVSISRLDSSNPNERYSEIVMALNDPNNNINNIKDAEIREILKQKSSINEEKQVKLLERVKTGKISFNSKNQQNEFPDKMHSANVAQIRQINKIETNKSLPTSGKQGRIVNDSLVEEVHHKVLMNNYTVSNSMENDKENLNSEEKNQKEETFLKQNSPVNIQKNNQKETISLNNNKNNSESLLNQTHHQILSNEITFINPIEGDNMENMNFSNKEFFSNKHDNSKNKPNEKVHIEENKEKTKSFIKKEVLKTSEPKQDLAESIDDKIDEHRSVSATLKKSIGKNLINELFVKNEHYDIDQDSERERLIRQKWNEIESNPFINVKPTLHHSSKEYDDGSNENEDKIENVLNEKKSKKSKKNNKKRRTSIGSHADSLVTASYFENNSEIDSDSDIESNPHNNEEIKFKSDNLNLESDWNGFLKDLESFDYEKLLKEYEVKNNFKVNSDAFKNFFVKNEKKKDLL